MSDNRIVTTIQRLFRRMNKARFYENTNIRKDYSLYSYGYTNNGDFSCLSQQKYLSLP